MFASAATGAVEDKVGVSTALITISRAVRGAVATQVAAGMISHTAPALSDFQLAFTTTAVIAIAGAIAAGLLLTRGTRALRPHPIPES